MNVDVRRRDVSARRVGVRDLRKWARRGESLYGSVRLNEVRVERIWYGTEKSGGLG